MNIPNICPCKQNICSASSDQFCFSNDFGPDAVLQNHNETRRLHLGFTGTPGQMDVICARGKVAQRHSGNERLRAIIESNVHEYAYAPTKLSKSTIVSSILDAVRDGNPRGGFVKYEGGAWHDVGDLVAREKIGQW